ncbi:MAG: hypothetical protein E7065_03550 [Lentimicrobiaceae bacterium]|nr:hypothetical protein [Lentimicrobiaceae bacterium]
MKTIDFTLGMSFYDIRNRELKNSVMNDEKEYIEKQEIIKELREVIFEGLESGISDDFNPETFLESLKREYDNV